MAIATLMESSLARNVWEMGKFGVRPAKAMEKYGASIVKVMAIYGVKNVRVMVIFGAKPVKVRVVLRNLIRRCDARTK